MFSDDPDRMLELPQPARNNASDVPAVKTAARRHVPLAVAWFRSPCIIMTHVFDRYWMKPG
jgi:hypothetical protein